MKKLALLLTAIILLGLTACADGGGAAITEGDEALETLGTLIDLDTDEAAEGFWGSFYEAPDFTNLTIIPDAASGESLELPFMWITEHGAYYVNTIWPEQSGAGFARGGGGRVVGALSTSFVGGKDDYSPITRIHIIDSATEKDMPLCNRVTCPHDSEDCSAYLPDDPVDPNEFNEWGFVSGRSWGSGGNTLFIDGEYIYALNSGTTFYRLGLDGSGRTEYMRLPDEYDFSWNRSWLMNGKLYMMAGVMVPLDDFGFQHIQAMIEVDYINKTINEIWRGEANTHISIIGLWSGEVFAVENVYPEWGHTPEDTMNYYNNQLHTFFSYNPATGQKTEIFSDTSYGFNGNFWEVPESGEIIFHSRRDETISRLNIRTGEVTVLAENIPGFLFIGDQRDGRISITRYNNDDWMITHENIDMDFLFFDINSGELGEITLKTRIDEGDDEYMYTLFAENGYYYVEVERETEEQGDAMWDTWRHMTRALLGRIPIDDYWASNADAIEELDWYDNQEWWDMLGEKQGWGRAYG